MSATPVSSAKLLGVSSYEEQQKTKSTSRNGEDMGKQDFLTLFTAQLKNQDPLDPVKNEAFVAQLAQFSQLEALTNMQNSLDKFVSSMSGERMLNSTALIGRKVAVATLSRNCRKTASSKAPSISRSGPAASSSMSTTSAATWYRN